MSKKFCTFIQDYLARRTELKAAVKEAKDCLEDIKEQNKKLKRNLDEMATNWSLHIQILAAYQEVLERINNKSGEN